MNSLLSFITAFCSVCVVLGGLSLLDPGGKMSKPVSLVFSLVFILTLVSSVLSVKDFSLEFPEISFSYKQSETLSGAAAKQVFEQALRESGIKYEKIEVCTDKKEGYGIVISEVVVYSSEPYDKICEVIGDTENYEVKVIDE